MAINLTCRLFSEINNSRITPNDHDAQTQDIRTLQSALLSEIALARANESAILTDFFGVFTLATLPDPIVNNNKRILVSDLGGGIGYLRAVNGIWKRMTPTGSFVQVLPVSAGITVDGLANSPIISLGGNGYSSKASMMITNATSLIQLTVIAPANTFSALGGLGLSVSGGTPLTVAGIGTAGTWNDFALSSDGTTLIKIRGGSL